MVNLIPIGAAGPERGAALLVGDDRLLGEDDDGGLDRGLGRGRGLGRRRAGPLAPPGHGGSGQAEQGEPRAEQR